MTPQQSTSRSNNLSKKSSNQKIVLTVVAVVIVITMIVLYMTCNGGKKNADVRSVRAVPVVATKAIIGNLPVILTSLGIVTPTDVVIVKTRVNGQLLRVSFTEGQMVQQGDLLAEIDPRPYEVQLMQAEGQRARNQAAYQHAKADLDRYKNLVDQGIVSKQQLDAQTAQTDQLAAALKSDDGSLESAKLNLTYCRITAPVSGRVGLRQVDPGNLVSTSDTNGIVVITPLMPIYVSFSVPAVSIGDIIKRDRDYKKIGIEAWNDNFTTKLAVGKLWAVDNQVDTTTGTVKFKALFDNQDASLFPNEFVNVRLYVDTLKKVVLIPSSAVQKSPQGDFVYVVKDDSTVEMRLINVMASQGEQTALTGGLGSGETVVTDGIEKLRPGAKISIPGASPQHDSGGAGRERQGQEQGKTKS
ncbi:MAG: MdtA/MuxA family multidrug efflux RND transporter periplasmic adaptor subunit [Holophagales bacterium]|jgi:multidrug efflux system membrane fusion protein|nr:MdtA/MuxA family multidrug efflux RND transporter periplasmic adaptor subunit [Holophagales bacterium]